jgi:hypothetical protein
VFVDDVGVFVDDVGVFADSVGVFARCGSFVTKVWVAGDLYYLSSVVKVPRSHS